MLATRRQIILGRLALLLLAAQPVACQEGAQEGGGNRNVRFGMPAEAAVNPAQRENYLIDRPQYVLSYNDRTKTPNWVCWNLTRTDIGNTQRGAFEPDESLPRNFERVSPKTYIGSGFDRGHMCNSKDRSDSEQNNNATFLMTNMVPQAPTNNQKTWEGLEEYCRTLAKSGKDLYIVAGPHGEGGTGKNGFKTQIGSGPVTVRVPAQVWKVVMVLDEPGAEPTRQTRMIAVIMPNSEDIGLNWTRYIVSVNDVERLTGYKFFPRIDEEVARAIKSEVDSGSTTPFHKTRRKKQD